jgi:hypothetical protein
MNLKYASMPVCSLLIQTDLQIWLFVVLCLVGFLWLVSAVLRVVFCIKLQPRIGFVFDVWTVVISFVFLVALFIYIFKYGGVAY